MRGDCVDLPCCNIALEVYVLSGWKKTESASGRLLLECEFDMLLNIKRLFYTLCDFFSTIFKFFLALVMYLSHCFFKFFAVIFIIGFYISFFLIENRYFVKFNSMDFTVWDTLNGTYIIPCKYYKLTFPADDYIRMPGNQSLTIFIDENETFHIFDSASYGMDCEKSEVTLKNINYALYLYSQNHELFELFRNKKDYARFDYDALENYGIIQEKNEEEYKEF